MSKPAVLIVSHGSREKRANAQFKALVLRYAATRPQYDIDYAFLELTHPLIGKRLEELAFFKQEIWILPLFLFAGGHINRDFPRISKTFSAKHPFSKIKMTNIVGLNPNLPRLAMFRALSFKGNPKETFLLLVGRGSRDGKVQRNMRKVADTLRKSRRFGKVGHCFYDMAEPNLEKALNEAGLSGFRSIRVVPYLFFNGDLISRIRAKIIRFSSKNKGLKVTVSRPLGIHPILFRAMDRCLKGTKG